MRSSSSAGASWAEWVRATGAVIFITGAGTVVMGTLPLLNGLFASRLKLDWHQLGWLGAAAQCGTLAGTLLGFWVIERRWSRVALQFGAACAVLAWLFGATAAIFAWLVVGRIITSIGLGCVFSIGAYAIAQTAQPARGFSVMSGVQVVCGAAHAAVLPWLHSQFGYIAAVASIAIWFVLILMVARIVPPIDRPAADAGNANSAAPSARPVRYAGAGLLLSLTAFQMATSTFWAYSERIAVVSGLTAADISTAVSIGNLGGVPAAILGALAGDRVGYLPILLLATITAVLGEIAMAGTASAGLYLFGQLAFNFGWMLGVSYYLALLAKRARDPRLIQAAPIALVIAGGLGPLGVALFQGSDSVSALLFASLLLCCAALIPAIVRRA